MNGGQQGTKTSVAVAIQLSEDQTTVAPEGPPFPSHEGPSLSETELRASDRPSLPLPAESLEDLSMVGSDSGLDDVVLRRHCRVRAPELGCRCLDVGATLDRRAD